MCDQKTAKGFSFPFTAQIYRQQQQGDKHTGSSKPLLASRSKHLLALNTKPQEINAAGMFDWNSAAGAQKCPWPLLVKACFCKSRWTVIVLRTWSFIDWSNVGWATDYSQHWQPSASVTFQPSSRSPGKMRSIFEVAVWNLKNDEKGNAGPDNIARPLLSADTRTTRHWDITKSFNQKLSGCSSKHQKHSPGKKRLHVLVINEQRGRDWIV